MKTTHTGQAGTSRRQFMRGALAAGAAGWTFARMDAASAARVVGANDRVSLGLIGCGGRGRWVMQNMVHPANANTALVAVCDIWKHRRDTYPAEAEKLYGLKPEVSADARALLDRADVDAVIIATPDHHHCSHTMAAVAAGKHVYVEKPIAPTPADLPELLALVEAVKGSKCVVQHGTQGVSGAGAAGWSFARMDAASAARVIGANDRVSLGLIGCGGRGRWVMQNMVQPANANTALVAVCDIWKKRRDTYPAEAEKLYGLRPEVSADARALLDRADVDAVIIATPDHHHCLHTLAAVAAGKHVYVEKPIAPTPADLPELLALVEAVKGSKCVVQHGTQGVSGAGAAAIRDFIRGGKLGRLFRIESTESLTAPYWNGYTGPETEAETDWKAFLHNRSDRPFNAHQHAKWMGYLDFTSGTIGGWMSHFINTVHFVTGCGLPQAATAFGARYAAAADPLCDAPDQTVAVLEYDGFFTQFNSHFGSALHSESTTFMFEKGLLRAGFGHDLGNPVYSSEGVDDSIPPTKLLDADPPYPGQAHIENWLGCIRTGGAPNAGMDWGYRQGVAVILADAACRQGRRVTFDAGKKQLV